MELEHIVWLLVICCFVLWTNHLYREIEKNDKILYGDKENVSRNSKK